MSSVNAPAVLDALDVRECAGYATHTVDLHLRAGGTVKALVYVAGEQNPNFLGSASADDIARHVVRCAGRSGRNDEYVLRLASALRELDVDDPHVFAVEQAVREEG